jgi:hypothetical protein
MIPPLTNDQSDTFTLSESFENQMQLEAAPSLQKGESSGNSAFAVTRVGRQDSQREFGRELTNDIS